MIKKALFILVLLSFNTLLAQNKSKEEVLQLIADDTCDCIKSDTETFNAKTSLQKKKVAIGLCMLKSYNERKKLNKKLRKNNIGFETLGEEVGIYMIDSCGAEFMALFKDDELDQLIEEGTSDDDVLSASKDEINFNMTGKLVSIHNTALSYILVYDDFNKEHTFLIVNQFEGNKLLKQENINKTFNITFKEEGFYDLSEQRSIKKKVIKLIELKK